VRAAVFFIAMVIVTPSQASDSCRSKTEARSHFGSVHIYWHGPNHCWDASPTGHRSVARIQHRERQVRRKDDPPRWRESRSQMQADSEPVQMPKEPVQMAEEPTKAPLAQEPTKALASGDARLSGYGRLEKGDAAPISTARSDRWTTVVQAAPIQMAAAAAEPAGASPIIEHETEAIAAPHGILLVFCGTALIIIGIIGVLFRFNAPFSFWPRPTGARW